MDYLWIPDYIKDIEADFLAIYHKPYETCDGPQFIRLASRLPYYDGCFTKKIQMEDDSQGGGNTSKDDGTYDGPMELSMREAVARNSNADTLDALNEDGMNSIFGPLFERTVVSG